jgi:two-component system LytT family response regulator
MDCILVDDDRVSRLSLRQLIEKCDFLNLNQEFTSSSEAFHYLSISKTDLIFLDVEMPEMSGIELIRNLKESPFIILTSGSTAYGPEAFNLQVIDYLVKPISLARFLVAMNRVKELYDSTKPSYKVVGHEIDYIFFRFKSTLFKIVIKEILYIQAFGDYVHIYTQKKKFTIHSTMHDLAKKLPESKFYRIHRCYLVALDHIDLVEDNTVYINDHPLPIGVVQKQELFRKLNLI